MNNKLFVFLFGLGQKHKFFGIAAKITAKYSYPFYYAVYLAGFALTLYRGELRELFMYIFIPFTVYLINNFTRSKLNKKRPFQENDIKPLLEHKTSPSCPCNHAACAVVIALVFTQTAVGFDSLPLICLGSAFIILAIFTGLSRVVCGIHYPRDIALGYFIGVFGWIVEYTILSNL
ncbi:MAG: phosphatase PAP2 family protein [Clostridiales bacterium]|nr:phosphatase PAP2 family protein [Clostridiales bacterium]